MPERFWTAAALAVLIAACTDPRASQVRSLMQDTVVPASDALFGAVVYTNGQLVEAPTSDVAWARLAVHATSLIDAAGRLRTLDPGQGQPAWQQQTAALDGASRAALDAIARRDLSAVLDTGSRIYDSCTACHAAYAVEE